LPHATYPTGVGIKKDNALQVVQLVRSDEYFFKECDEDEGVFIAQHIGLEKDFLELAVLARLWLTCPQPFRLYALNLGFSRLFGVDWGTWKQCVALVVLTGLLAAYSTVANVKQKSTTTLFLALRRA
jgi:hypothetical protein